jgi:hypothetical protein
LGNRCFDWRADPPKFRFWNHALGARGSIAGTTVQCITPQMQVICHTGYTMPEAHQRDMERLKERFSV